MYQVYAIRCKENGRIYIGCTKRPVSERISDHFRQLSHHDKTKYTYIKKHETKHEPSTWQIDYDNYGKDAFEFYILESEISDENHRKAETKWIEEYKSWDERYGYNIRRGVKVRPKYDFQNGLPPKPFDD